MAYLSARLTRYERVMNADETQILRIFAAGVIRDDTRDEEYPTEYWIVGAEMAYVGQLDPVNYPLPGNKNANGEFDPHVLKVREILAREAKRAHASWMQQLAAQAGVKVIQRDPETLANTPPITAAELPLDDATPQINGLSDPSLGIV